MKSQKNKNKEKDHLHKLKLEQRRAFFANFKNLCNSIAGFDAFASFTPTYLDEIYRFRFYNIKVVAKEAGLFTAKELQTLNAYFKSRLSESYFAVNEKVISVPLNILLVEGMTLFLGLERLIGNEFPKAPEIKKIFEPLAFKDELFPRILQAIANEIQAMSLMFSSLTEGFVWASYNFKLNEATGCIENMIIAEFEKPPIKYFMMDGNSRPAMQLGWAFAEVGNRYLHLKPSTIGLCNAEDDANAIPIDVYVQSHALIRLNERLGLDVRYMHYALFTSFLDMQYHWDKNGKLMVAFIYFGTKMGYLVCSLQNDFLLVHSFLFITYNGTPEGNKLFELTGLGKIDKKYLAIDTLESLLSYNINEHPFVKDIFIKAGCGELLDFKDNANFNNLKFNNLADAKVIEKYLNNLSEIPDYKVSIV